MIKSSRWFCSQIALALLAIFLSPKNLCGFDVQPINFLSVAAASQIIAEDKQINEYFLNLTTAEINMKSNGEASTVEDYKRYCQKNLLTFTEIEKSTLMEYSVELCKNFRFSYPLVFDRPLKFIKVTSNVEAGDPFTLNDYIFLSSNIFNPELKSPKVQFLHTLIEEQFHILQRLKPDKFTGKFESMGFQKINKKIAGIPNDHFTNPDCVPCNWLFVRNDGTRIFIFSSGFEKEAAIKVSTNNETIGDAFILSTATVPEYKKFYQTQGRFDPNEVIANIFAQMLTCDKYKDTYIGNCVDALAIYNDGYRNWFEKNLK